MGKRWAIRSLLLLTVITITKGQYFDILQGLQQLFQPYQGSDFVTQYNGVQRPQTQKHTNRQETKKKTNEQRQQHDERRTKKPPTNQYEYIFATTEKPRKPTKSNSSQTNSRNYNKNQYSNILIGEYFNPFEVTTKASRVNKVKTTTPIIYNNYYNNDVNRVTTENVFSNVNNNNNRNNGFINRPVTENVFENVNRKENYAINLYEPSNLYNNDNNRRPDSFNYNNNAASFVNNPPVYNNNNRGNSNGNNDRGILNTDYNIEYPSSITNNRRPTVYSTNPPQNSNRGTSNNNRDTSNNSNRGTTNNSNRGTTNNSNRGTTNNSNRGTTNNSNRGTTNNSNRGTTNNRGNNHGGFINTDYNPDYSNSYGGSNYDRDRPRPNQQSPNNYGSTTNNNYNPNQYQFNYPTDNPLINRPGVQPAPVDIAQPPITNRPVPDKHDFFSRPDPVPDVEPEFLIGPDEDDMSEWQKRRYVDLAETMCDRYKSLTLRKVVALPLVPSPSPVELNVSDCTPINVPLVIGGKIVSIREFPHMALVGWMKTRTSGYSWKCGGSLISDQYILTAGHCTYQDKDYDVVSGPPQAVQLGSSYLDDPGALVVKVAAIIRHPKYKQRRSYHDIALIKMVSRVTFSENIRPACLGVPPPEGDNIIATGWGRTEFGGDHSFELRSVSLPVWNMAECREIWGTSLKLPNGVTPDSHVCAGEKGGGKDTCQGDSGGPAQVQDGCLWRVVAVTSFGRSCGAPQTPALYAVIPHAFVAAQVFTEQS